ncbi:hypothetical protein ABN034_06205 [Actinopolymorpha sp. B11F2]|uniref:hypothetical protein n=1 Tax=Actinopolymorpha sp. B11F2 TaxID=3160862 RepID=UPI0032E4BAE4
MPGPRANSASYDIDLMRQDAKRWGDSADVLKKAQQVAKTLELDRHTFSVVAEHVTAAQRFKDISATYKELLETVIRLLGEGQSCFDTMESHLLTVARNVEENEDVNHGTSTYIERSIDGGN